MMITRTRTRTRTFHRSAPYVLSLLLLASGTARGEQARAAPATLAYDPAKARILVAEGPRVAWYTSELIEATRMHRAPSYVIRYYVQKLDEPAARLAHTARGTSWSDGRGCTILPDGSLLLHHLREVTWAAPGRPPRELEVVIDKELYDVLAAWPDGVVVQTASTNRFAPLHWVPIDAQRQSFDLKARRQMSDDAGLRTYTHPRFLRAGDRIAWVDATHTERHDKATQLPPRLHVYDLVKHARKTTDLPADKIGVGASLSAFDGEHAIGQGFVIDVETGRFTAAQGLGGLGLCAGKVYTFSMPAADQPAKLLAAPIATPDKPAIAHRYTSPAAAAIISKWAKDGYSSNSIWIIQASTVHVWDGTAGWTQLGR